MKAFRGLSNQCLQRDPGWKDWYVEQMNEMESGGNVVRSDLLNIFETEVSAEREFQGEGYDRAARHHSEAHRQVCRHRLR